MPKAFDDCAKNGGKIRTKRINSDEYMHICVLDGKTYAGEVKKYKKLSFKNGKKS